MQIGVISDVHGNAVALNAVLEDMPPVDRIVNAGDVVGYGPHPGACIDTLRANDVASILGNHDRAVVEGSSFRFNSMAAAGVRYARGELTDAQRDWLADLPTDRTLIDGALKLVHGHPDDPDRYTYSEEFTPELLGDESVLVLGHTHVQHAARFSDGLVLNPGSVGQPRDGDPRAAYAVLDVERFEVDLHRVEYDVEAVIEAVRAAGLPERIGTRLRDGT